MQKLKKSLGQHFLKDEGIILRIIDVLKEMPFKNLLEVGPGGGALTKHLVNIKDIELLKLREGTGGTFRVGFESDEDADRAVAILQEDGHRAHRL